MLSLCLFCGLEQLEIGHVDEPEMARDTSMMELMRVQLLNRWRV